MSTWSEFLNFQLVLYDTIIIIAVIIIISVTTVPALIPASSLDITGYKHALVFSCFH